MKVELPITALSQKEWCRVTKTVLWLTDPLFFKSSVFVKIPSCVWL